MEKKRFLMLLLSLVMLLGVFSGCKNHTDTPNTNTGSGTKEEDLNRLPVPVEQEDHQNAVFTILMPEENTLDQYSEHPANRVESSIVRATEAVNDRLGIYIQYKQLPCAWDKRATFNRALQAQSSLDKSEYDLIMGTHSSTFCNAVQNNLVMDLLSLNSIDTSSPWYLRDMADTYLINGKMYGGVSDASLTLYSSMIVMFFNQETVLKESMTNPYEYVENNGEWYAQTMFEMALQVSGVNTDEAVNLDSGTFGYICKATNSRGFFEAFDVKLTYTDNKDHVYFNEDMSLTHIDKYDYLYRMFENNPYYLHISRDGEGVEEKLISCFSEGRSLFYQGQLSAASSFHGVAWDYGIVPMPKYDSNQTSFCTPLSSGFMTFMIMRNADDAELSAKVFELMSYYKYYDSVPEYYDIVLKVQYAKDHRQAAMLDLVRESCTYSWEAAFAQFTDPVAHNLYQMDDYWRNEKVKGAVSTYYRSNATLWNTMLTRIYNSMG